MMKRFADAPNTAVITTIYVVKFNSPIMTVYHFDDGYWQFSGTERNLLDKDFMVLALEEIVALDPSVLEISDLPLGRSASRETIQSKWVISDAKII